MMYARNKYDLTFYLEIELSFLNGRRRDVDRDKIVVTNSSRFIHSQNSRIGFSTQPGFVSISVPLLPHFEAEFIFIYIVTVVVTTKHVDR